MDAELSSARRAFAAEATPQNERLYFRAWERAGKPGNERREKWREACLASPSWGGPAKPCDVPWCGVEDTGDDYGDGPFTYCERHNSIILNGGSA